MRYLLSAGRAMGREAGSAGEVRARQGVADGDVCINFPLFAFPPAARELRRCRCRHHGIHPGSGPAARRIFNSLPVTRTNAQAQPWAYVLVLRFLRNIALPAKVSRSWVIKKCRGVPEGSARPPACGTPQARPGPCTHTS